MSAIIADAKTFSADMNVTTKTLLPIAEYAISQRTKDTEHHSLATDLQQVRHHCTSA